MNVRRIFLVFIGLVFTFSSFIIPATPVGAVEQNCNDDFYSLNNISFYDPCDTTCTPAAAQEEQDITNTDYRGAQILSSAQLTAIEENKSIYENAGKQSGVPWQMIAVLHLREHSLKKDNPSNGQGIYQDSTQSNGPYPTGPVDDEEFLRQSIWAGNFIKNKSTNPERLATGDVAQIKDAFFGYNGRAGAYTDQAIALGYTKTQGYEGSPYVMNKADRDRDPLFNKTTWGQIQEDGGEIEYPANNIHGAFVIYASLAGISLDGNCGVSGELGERIATLAEAEYALWESGAMKPGFRLITDPVTGVKTANPNSFAKYTKNQSYDWCAMFVSWILIQAGHPIVGGNRGDSDSFAVAFNTESKMSQTGFIIHDRAGGGYGGYTPKRGDIVVYEWSNGNHHVNIIVGYDEDTKRITTVGGNEGTIPWTSSYVRQYSRPISDSQIMSITEVRE
jgi:hypothetical protein